jgi:uncharacterized Zn finger protein
VAWNRRRHADPMRFTTAVHGFGPGDLLRLAGSRSYERGEGYLDAVVNMLPAVDGVRATVHGTEPYVVRLSWTDGRLAGECSCPFGAGGAFCKHCVAVGLVWLAEDGEPGEAAPDELRAYLESLDRAALVDLLYERAMYDEELRRLLELRAAAGGAAEPDVAALRQQIDSALRVRGFVDYTGSFDYARRADAILDTLSSLLDAGHAAIVVELAERVITVVTQAVERMDDSSGVAGDACQRAATTHAQACLQAPPDPARLARWLLDRQLNGPGWPELALADYADALGELGLARYRKEVRSRWEKLPALGSGDVASFDHGRFGVTLLMEQVAALDGVDALVAVLARDLSSPWQYARIATELAQAGRPGDALAWAKRGLAEHPQAWSDPRLVEIAVEQLVSLGEHEDAVALRRRSLERVRSVGKYLALREQAAGRWAELRDWARGMLSGEHLVRALLADGEPDEAWAVARDASCSDEVWLQLAEHRAGRFRLEAAEVLRPMAARRIELRDKRSYDEAADMVRRIRELHRQAGEVEAFADYLAELRRKHKPKRNFMAALVARGL